MRSKTYFLPLLFLLFSQTLPAQSTGSLSLQVDIPEAMVPSTPSGRLFVFLSEQNRPEPRRQLWPSYNNYIFAVNLGQLGWQSLSLPGDLDLFTMADFDLASIPEGTYYLQVLSDHDREESGPNAPGNLYSKVEKIELKGELKLQLSLEQAIPPRQLADHPLVKMIELKSDTLTKWWARI
jgi:hypothetical protein